MIAGVFGLAALKNGQRAQADRELQDNRAREETLRSYLDRIAELVLEKNLADSDTDAPQRAIALARTHNALTTLDGPRKGLLVRFLKAAQLIQNKSSVIPLSLANLTDSDLSGADLRACDFSGANLSDADFFNSDLRECNLENCVLSNEQLAQCADLVGAILPNGELATDQTLNQLQSEGFER